MEMRIKRLIVEALNLEDIRPEDIDSGDALFVDGLGLDSIDALELGVAIRQTFGIKIDANTADVKVHFATVANLARFVEAQLQDAD